MTSKCDATVLVINCGSSSLKYRVIRMPEETECARGEAVRVGIRGNEPSAILHSVNGLEKKITVPLPDHAAAFREIISLLSREAKGGSIPAYDCFAHRYVHPGPRFTHTVKIDAPVIARLRKAVSLAPVHNKVCLDLIENCAREFQDIPQYAVFDTAFHSTIPPEYAAYALPEKLAKKHHLRKIGFHGISHQYIARESCRFLGRDPSTQKIISCHLGSGGSSICAIKDGVSINSSMGFTPLEGLMMNTRSGDLDIGVLFQVMARNNLSAEEAEKMLNFKSGILGVFNSSSDMRDVARNSTADRQAQVTFDMYVRRVRKFVGYYSILLKKADILVFTDTLGIELPEVRRSVCEGMECFGIALDVEKNQTADYRNTDLTGKGSQAKVLAIPTNEEIMIARESFGEYCHDHRSRAVN